MPGKVGLGLEPTTWLAGAYGLGPSRPWPSGKISAWQSAAPVSARRASLSRQGVDPWNRPPVLSRGRALCGVVHRCDGRWAPAFACVGAL